MTIQFEKTHTNLIDYCKKTFNNIKISDTFRYPVDNPNWWKEEEPVECFKEKDKKVYMRIKNVIDSNNIYKYYNAVDFNGNLILIDDQEWVQPIEITANWKYSLD